MKYEKPAMVITELEKQDIITLSFEQGGDGPVVTSDDGSFAQN